MKYLFISLIIMGASCSSKKDDPKPDVGVTVTDVGGDSGGSGADIGTKADVDVDVDVDDSCVTGKIDAIFKLLGEDDASIEIRSKLGQKIGQYGNFRILFENYVDGPDIGTFDLSADRDGNFGNCSHCVFIAGATPETILYAQSGTLVNKVDPYSRQMDIEITNLVLVESTVEPITRVSTPIEGGICVKFPTITVKKKFQPSAWLCGEDKYIDGEFCDCECGAIDPDCSNGRYCLPGGGGPNCPDPLPVRGCATADQICKFDVVTEVPRCLQSCDWDGRVPCDTGVCVFDDGGGTQCISATERLSPQTLIGEMCTTGDLQAYCNIVNGFAEGLCDPNGTTKVCRALCTSDAECTAAGETCLVFKGPNSLGFCGPIPVDG